MALPASHRPSEGAASRRRGWTGWRRTLAVRPPLSAVSSVGRDKTALIRIEIATGAEELLAPDAAG